MNTRLLSRLKRSAAGGVLLLSLVGCSTVGAGNDVVPGTFLDEGGTSQAVEGTLSGHYLAGRQALRARDTEAAWEYFSKAYQNDPEDELLLGSAFQAALADGQIEEAISLARLVEARNLVGVSTARLVLAIENIRTGAFEEAAGRVAKIQPDRFNILLKPVLQAWILVAQGNLLEANKALDELDKYNGFKLLKPYHLALLAHASGQDDVAREAYDAALKGPSGRAVRLVQSYGIFLLEQGQRDAALKLFTDYRTRYPMSPTIQKIITTLEAGGSLEPLIGNPAEGAAEALYSSASIISQQQINDVAVTLANFALRLRPDLTPARILLAEVAEDRLQYARAREYYSAIPKNSPYALNARIRVAWLTYRLGEEDQAIQNLEQLIAENPGNIEPLIVLADLSRDRKDWDRAARNYGFAIDNIGSAKSRLWSLYYARGIAYERKGTWDKAEADLKKAMELRPDNPQILNYLGYSWVDRGENLEEAKSLLIKAVALRPQDGYIVDSLGWLYYRLADFENAVIQLEKAVALQPEDPTINDHLGDAYWKVGRKSEARYQWQRALWLEPEEDLVPGIQKKLDEGMPDGGSDK
ncbi:tetratricopeptide repeat protein [Sneathiella sp. P13V-1]|uniref:tetratricopeptide repeat protein n=1 Tax=Sneathiella sp. P13V-1 TaxID=2697366 RepID=UPI00187B984E|nr:tetratricopeptide repeat protein [Sneathiella sp. P13V-1]MBE7635554.1 tetratricopeptide repeat protein [Sneathiella sp. P13V-1]